MQVLAHFITPPSYFDRVSIISMLSSFFLDNDMQPLLSVCFHIQCMSFNLEQQNQLHIATCLENEWGSLKLDHFETVRLNRGPQN